MRLQSLLKLTIGFCVASLILTACDSGGDTPPEENADADSQVVTPAETAVFLPTDAPTVEPTATNTPALPPPTAVPLELQFDDLSAGQYSFSMVGALSTDIGFTPFDVGLAGVEYKLAPNGTNQDGPYQVELWSDILTDGTTEDTTARIIFILPASVGSGTVTVIGRDQMTSPTDVGVEIVTGFGTQRFGTTATGSINIIANGGVAGVFTAEFNELAISDEAGNTILASGRTSAIPFRPQETADLTLSGAIEYVPSFDQLIYALSADTGTAANNDWRLDVTAINTEDIPYIIQHRLHIRPNLSAGTYEITPRVSELDARPEDLDATGYVELFNVNDGTQIIPEDVTGTLEVLPIRDSFSATFTLTYTIGEDEEGNPQTVTATAGAYYLYKPAN